MSGLAASKSAMILSSTSFSLPPVVACVMRNSVCAIAAVVSSAVTSAAAARCKPFIASTFPVQSPDWLDWYVIGLSPFVQPRILARGAAKFGLPLPNQNHTSAGMDFYDAVLEQMKQQHGPLGERLRHALSAVLDTGVIAPGESLPAEREMAARLDVSRSTLRQGLKDLAQQGIVATRPGAGTVVVGRIPKALSRLSGF